MAMRVCSVAGCPDIYDQREGSRCGTHRAHADRARGTAKERGYKSHGHTHRFRPGVLDRDPICVRCHLAESTVADHYPRDKRELIALGLDSNDPQYGRGLCKPCHDVETAQHQPGGWHGMHFL